MEPNPVIDSFFKHQIGDVLVSKAAAPQCYRRSSIPLKDEKIIVLIVRERHLQQCHGGVQSFYVCTQINEAEGYIASNGNGRELLTHVTEAEVITLAEYDAKCKKAKAARDKESGR